MHAFPDMNGYSVGMKWETVFEAFNPVEAQLVWSRLDAAGFNAQIANELSALSTEGYSMATGGVQVQVTSDRLNEAKAFLASDGEQTET